jgi:hypothetical protein
VSEVAVCGIDVAFAKHKPLPVCVCVRRGATLTPLPLRRFRTPPRGAGNRRALDAACVEAFAEATAAYLRDVERAFGVAIARVAIDAPRDYAPEGGQRACERRLAALRVACFTTPSRRQFAEIRRRARRHLDEGGAEATLPHANKLWMLVGFALFRRLEAHAECLEVFPNAIVRSLDVAVGHKSTRTGFARQVAVVSEAAGWPAPTSAVRLDQIAYGSRHDKLDAFMAAWVASLPRARTLAHGDGARDTIWVPRTPVRA